MKRIYLGGTFPKKNAEEFRKCEFEHNKIKALLLANGFIVLSPFRGKGGKPLGWETNEIVHRDEADIDQCDYMVCLMTAPSIGSSMEIYRAREICGIPVIVLTTNTEVSNHYWIKAKTTKVVDNIKDCIDFLLWLED